MLNKTNNGLQIPIGEKFYIGERDTEGSIEVYNDGGGLKHSVYLDGSYKNISSHNQGYDLIYNTDYIPICTFDGGTREITVGPQIGKSYFYFLSNGKLFIKDINEYITIPDITGGYYIYYDNNGVLQYILQDNITGIEFYQYAITYYIYRNKDIQLGLSRNEKHGIDMDATTHGYNHNTFGARYSRGLAIEGLASGTKTFTQISEGVFYDEDIKHIIDDTTVINTLWREGTAGDWRWTTSGTNEVGYKPSGNTYYVWNQFDGTTWKLTEGLQDSDFYIYFFIAFPGDDKGRVFRIPGQNAYGTVGEARDAIETEKNKLITDGLPGPEFIFIGSAIIRRNGKLRPLDDGSLYLDLRTVRGGTSNQSNIVVESGTYTPTLVYSHNVDGYTIYKATYNRIGNIVTVFGNIHLDTSANTLDVYATLSLPINSNIDDYLDVNGVISSYANANTYGIVYANTTNIGANIKCIGFDNGEVYYSYQYIIK